jgi:hypothetical protein
MDIADRRHSYSGLSGYLGNHLGKGFAEVSSNWLDSSFQLGRFMFKRLLLGSMSLLDMAYKNSILSGLGKCLQGKKFIFKR